ncbi:hypothetical protein [Thalassolituus oleivorans]|uniref:hypothetical protein n=1 Tax=Thalassolituus oleivorans TaxID=187493 RepID=UPI001CE2F79F|nr:hypothetical protein [Thalassolituus oleivorans]MCA6128703.1 hypothetical protein [Thalassolituus oleivorans 4BN06-13]
MTLVKLLSIIVLSTVAKLAVAAPLVNEMQGCQGILDFVNVKVSQASDLYSKNDISAIKKGLDAYNSYIQNEIITPSIAATVANDKNKAASLQKQINDYRATLVTQLSQRYPQKPLVTDYVVLINECTKKAAPAGEPLEALKVSFQLIVQLANQK